MSSFFFLIQNHFNFNFQEFFIWNSLQKIIFVTIFISIIVAIGLGIRQTNVPMISAKDSKEMVIAQTSKMPVYFEDGKSPLTDLLEGDAEKQIEAVWQYLRLGLKMPLPSTGAQ